MSVTRNIQSSALFSMPFIGYQPVNISNGEPAITAANLTKQTILGPPFTWNYNRGHLTIPLSVDDQDYFQTMTDFGFLEKVWLTDEKGIVKEIEVRLGLSAESAVKRPSSISAQTMESDGDVTFRLNTIPDQPYTLDASYQKAPILMSSLANTWGPIPDHLSYIYDWGFLSFVSLLTKDARFPIFGGRFTSHLLGAQDGLTALQRNIFLGNFLEVMTQTGRAQMTAQQGVQARGQ